MSEYMTYMSKLDTMSDDIYRYLNFDEIEEFMEASERAKSIPVTNIQDVA
jgi:aconitate hydratase 2/2-methylisocitrate dehydratase